MPEPEKTQMKSLLYDFAVFFFPMFLFITFDVGDAAPLILFSVRIYSVCKKVAYILEHRIIVPIQSS